MDRIDAEIMQCCLELKDLFCLGIVFDPKSIEEWEELKRRDSKYSKLCDEEDSTWVGMQTQIKTEEFIPFEFRNVIINHIAQYIFIKVDSKGAKLGFSKYKLRMKGSAKTLTIQTPFNGKADVIPTLGAMAKMCDQKVSCEQFRKFVYGMFPRLKRAPSTVLGLTTTCPGLNIRALAKLYINDDGFREIPSDGCITFAKGDTAVAWFTDGCDITVIPTESGRTQTEIAQLATYVYIVKYDRYDTKKVRWHKIIVGWMGFSHPFGIVYKSVEWDVDDEDEARKFHIVLIRASYNAAKRVFRQDTPPLVLSKIFWGLMYANSCEGYVNGVKPKGIEPRVFLGALDGDISNCLKALTLIASGSDTADLVPNRVPSRTTECYRFKTKEGKNFEWKWDRSMLRPVSFGFV